MYRALVDVELFADIMCALSNMHLVCPLSSGLNHAVLGPLDGCTSRAQFFLQLYAPAEPLLCFPATPPDTLAHLHPPPNTWSRLLAGFPADRATISTALRALEGQLFRLAMHAPDASILTAIATAHRPHQFPSARAEALFVSHFVLLVEYALEERGTSGTECVVQAHVRASQRGSSMYYPRIKFRLPDERQRFSLDDVDCPCIAGYGAPSAHSSDQRTQLIYTLLTRGGASTRSARRQGRSHGSSTYHDALLC